MEPDLDDIIELEDDDLIDEYYMHKENPPKVNIFKFRIMYFL